MLAPPPPAPTVGYVSNDRERGLLLSRTDQCTRAAANRALAHRYLCRVLSPSSSVAKAKQLASFSIDSVVAALTALAMQDYTTTPQLKVPHVMAFEFESGAQCAGDLILHMEDPRVRTTILRRIPTACAADILATMPPIDVANCLGRLPHVGPQAAVLAAMEPHEAADVIEVSTYDSAGQHEMPTTHISRARHPIYFRQDHANGPKKSSCLCFAAKAPR